MPFVEMIPGREELIHSSLLVWRTVKLSAVLHSPHHHPKSKISETKNKKTLLFILIEAKTKTLHFGL